MTTFFRSTNPTKHLHLFTITASTPMEDDSTARDLTPPEEGKRRCYGRGCGQRRDGMRFRLYDDDDILYPVHFETLIDAMKRRRLNVAYSNSEKALTEKTSDGYRIIGREPREQHPFDKKQMLVMNYIPVHNLVFRRECLDTAGIFDENLVIHEDWDMWVRLSRNYDFAPVYENTADVRWWTDKSSLTFQRRAPSRKHPP